MIRMGGGLLVAALAMRLVQMLLVAYRGGVWWLLELTRWTMHVAIAIIALHVVSEMRRELLDHRERLASIEAAARLARAQLDPNGPGEYLRVVSG